MNASKNCGYLALMLASAGLTPGLAAITYNLTDLGPGTAADINASGQIVGNDTSVGGWYFDGSSRVTLQFQAHPLGDPAGTQYSIDNTAPAAISDNGRIVSICVLPDLPAGHNLYGFFEDVGGDAVVLQPYDQFQPYGVNASGVIVGSYSYFDGTSILGLAKEPPFNVSVAAAINAAGLTVGGIVPNRIAPEVAAIYNLAANSYSFVPLGTISGTYGVNSTSQATGVNGAGQIVGVIWDKNAPLSDSSTPFLYNGGTVSGFSLGSLGGHAGQPKDINETGTIVGKSTVADGTYHAFIYANGVMTDLNSRVETGGSGWVLNSANAVNYAGVIVGDGLKNGVAHAFRLVPTVANELPAISAPPIGGSVLVGADFTFSVTATGPGTLTYQWQHAGTNLPGAISRTYSLTPATLADAGGYRVLISNANGGTTSPIVTLQVAISQNLSLAIYAGITVTGTAGQKFRIEAVEAAGDTHWQPLANVILAATSFLWLDPDGPQHPHRQYRTILVP